jgi:ribonuclease HII
VTIRRSGAADGRERLRERLLRRERELWDEGRSRVAGVDEAGVGPLAGPVVAAAVYFAPGAGIVGVNDSKQLSARARDELARRIRERALAWCVARVEPGEIDRINVYQAALLAMRRAVCGLQPSPDYVLVDGRDIPRLPLPQEKRIGGDASCFAIAAASILAKTARDRIMLLYDEEFPGYGFAAHKGYPTAAHRAAIRRLGPSPIHRRSFALLPPPGLFD